MTNIFILVNPVSANGSTEKVWPEIEAEIKKRELEFDSHLTTGVGDATLAVQSALKNGATTIIAIGGDGTANEVINGFFENETLINPQARLGIISRGTGCDLIRTLGIPKGYQGALDVIQAGREKEIDLALVEFIREDGVKVRRFYANIADAGLGAAACKRVNSGSKSAGGMLSYLTGALGTLIYHKNHWARIEADGKQVFAGPIVLAAVANGCYFGGGMRLAPIACIDDGKLDLIFARGMSKPRLLVNLVRIYLGTHLSDPYVSNYRVSEVCITGDEPLDIEMDGETPGTTPARIWVRPKAIKVLC